MDEFDNFIAKQQSFNDYVSRQLEQNARMLSHLSACVDRNVNDLKLLSKHASMVTTQKKKDDRNLHASNPIAATPESQNDVFVSDAETQSGDEHEPNDDMNSNVHEDAQPSNDKDVEIEPVDLDNPQPKNKRYDKNDFAARKLGKEREPWVQKPMPFPPKPSKKKDDEDFERFVEMIRPVFLQMRLTDMLKMSPYAKYMKDIMTNKRKIPEVVISTMLANYTFKGGPPKKLGDPGVPTIPCSIKGNYVRTVLCDLGAGVSVMPLSLYRRLELDKLTPTEISLQMADKSTAFPIGICEDMRVVVANVTILTDFVILDIPEDDAMVIEHCHLYAPDLSILKSAVTGDKSFNMGAIIARRLNNNANEGDFFGGIYATRIANFLGVPIREGDPPLHTAFLDRTTLTRYQFLERDDESILYRLIFNRQRVFHITLPAPAFFDFQKTMVTLFSVSHMPTCLAVKEPYYFVFYFVFACRLQRSPMHEHSYYCSHRSVMQVKGNNDDMTRAWKSCLSTELLEDKQGFKLGGVDMPPSYLFM
nr:retropepsin domain-containing protein [Hordeum vulgare subsp. vulgare]